MLPQLLTRCTVQTRNIYSLIQSVRSVSHLCASTLIGPFEHLTLRGVTVPMTMKLQNANYRTKKELKELLKKKEEMQIKADEHVALRKLFAPMIAITRKVKKITKQKKTSRAVGHVGRLDMRVGRVVEVQETKQETLFLTKVDIGGGEIRSIAVGLAKFMPADQLLNQNVVILCNINPAPLKGHFTHGMIMCAKSGNIKEPLIPPSNAKPGDLVHCENFERIPHKKPRYKRSIFDPLAPDMQINNELVACYRSNPLYIPKKGSIVTKSLKNGNIA